MANLGVKERHLEGQFGVDSAKRMEMAVVNTRVEAGVDDAK